MFYRFNHGLQWRNALYTPLAVMSCAMSLSGLIGCAASPTALDQNFGQSSRQAIVLQTLDTQAYARAKLAPGTDGHTASLVVERYYKSVELPPQPIRIMNSGVGVVPTTSVSR